MTGMAAPATRSSLLRSVRRLGQVHRGAALLRRKRQSLVEELFARAKNAVASRETIDTQARHAWHLVWRALCATGSHGLRPLGWPMREIDVEMTPVDHWGIRTVEIRNRPALVRSLAARGIVLGPGDAVSHEAARQFEALIEQLLDAAAQEHAMRRLGQALARTTRLVNTLEQRVAVRLGADVAAIRRTLSEREREEQVRTKRLIARRRSSPRGAGSGT
jgi:vacuolar-type H+-ATPase subunit D/Vma8